MLLVAVLFKYNKIVERMMDNGCWILDDGAG
jgi:hypothetical protein